MATNPTKRQTLARDQVCEILLLIGRASRDDGGVRNTPEKLDDLAQRVASLSSAYTLDEIVARSLESRARSLGISSGLAEMITLLDTEITPLRMLWVDDSVFLLLMERIQQDLGELE